MRESIMSPSNHPPARTAKLVPEQIAQRSTWHRVPDAQVAVAGMHIIHVRPVNGSTITAMNPLDPGTIEDPANAAGPGWLMRPHAAGTMLRARSGLR